MSQAEGAPQQGSSAGQVRDGERVDEGVASQPDADTGHQPDGDGVDAIEHGAERGRGPHPPTMRANGATKKMNDGRKIPIVARTASRMPAT
jgi:hypothetical protein